MNEAGEAKRRRLALAVFGVIVLVFICLSAVSFLKSRDRPDPASVVFLGYTAVDGKRVFQAYNCMGCHTILGNGAYFAPDLTGVAGGNGPAWLMAFLSKLDVWPAKTAVDPWIEELRKSGDITFDSTDAYYEKYEGAASDVAQRAGWSLIMPKLSFRSGEIESLVAFLDYASRIDTRGWPPESSADPSLVERTQAELHRKFRGPRTEPGSASPAAP